MIGKEIRQTAVPAFIVGIIALSSCTPADVESQTPLPAVIEQVEPIISAWNNLSAAERANRLELKDFPENLDINTEIIRAISELYSQQMPNKISKEMMQANTHFTDTATFLQKFQEDIGRPFANDAEREKAEATPESVFNSEDPDRTKWQVFINKLEFSSLTAEIINGISMQDIANLGDYDLETIIKESVISHALSHLNQSDEKLDFLPLVIATNQEIFAITGIHGLNLQLTNLDNNSSFELIGTAEAMTEINGSLVERTSNMFVFSNAYYPATTIVQDLNKKAGIDNDEFKDYYSGDKSIKDLLLKWGSLKDPKNPSINLGISLYFLVASSIEKGNDPSVIRQEIEQEIGQKF